MNQRADEGRLKRPDGRVKQPQPSRPKRIDDATLTWIAWSAAQGLAKHVKARNLCELRDAGAEPAWKRADREQFESWCADEGISTNGMGRHYHPELAQ